MTEPFNTELYEQQIDEMRDWERFTRGELAGKRLDQDWANEDRNIERLAAYKRRRAAWALEGPLV